MVYKTFTPSAALAGFVRNYTIIHFRFGTSTPPAKERSPKPEQKIVFYLKGTPEFHNPVTGNSVRPSSVSIFSHQVDRKTIKLSSEFFALIIFLHPGVLHRMIHLPMMELFHQSADAELFFGTEIREVSDQLYCAPNFHEMISVAERFMLVKCRDLMSPSAIDQIALHLLGDPVRFSLDMVSREACLSSKQFYRKFTEKIGISPNLFSRLSRFNHAYRYRLSHPERSWTFVSQEFGYTDYHHMEKEFKEFTGRTPQNWLDIHLEAPERIMKLR